jgi:hypothetical protein
MLSLLLSIFHDEFQSFTPRLISATEGSDGDAFTALMSAVATKKPVIVFSLILKDGKLLPEIKLNSDKVEVKSEDETSADALSAEYSFTNVAESNMNILSSRGSSSNSSSSFSSSKRDLNATSCSTESQLEWWTRECRLPSFSFCTQLEHMDSKPEDVELRIRTNIMPKVNRPEDQCEGFPIHHSLLKSMLQKAVRRRLTESTIRLSLALAHISTIELLRYSTALRVSDMTSISESYDNLRRTVKCNSPR